MTLGVPVVSAVAAWWLLDEGMSAGQLVGGAIVLGALAVDRRPTPQPRPGRGRARADLTGLHPTAKGAAMQRLSGLDASFLYLETPSSYMHVAGLMILDPSTAPVEWSFDEVRDMYAAAAAPRAAVPATARRGAVRPPSSGVDRGPRLRPRLPSPSHRRALAGRRSARSRRWPRRSSPDRSTGGSRCGRRGSSRASSTATSRCSPRRITPPSTECRATR